MKRIILVVLLVAAVVAVAILGVVGLVAYLNYEQTTLLAAPPAHGTEFILEADFSQTPDVTNAFAVLHEPLRKRFLKFGVRVFIEPVSALRIRVVAPITNSADTEIVEKSLFQSGFLEFRLVHPDSNALIQNGKVPPGYEVLKDEVTQSDGQKKIERLIVKKKAESGLSGDVIKSAHFEYSSSGEPQIAFTLTTNASAAFGRVTRENIGRRLAIVVDGRLYSAPVIQSPIETGNGVITGLFTPIEAHTLAGILDCPLPVRIRVVESKTF